jgi:hypothetical protein
LPIFSILIASGSPAKLCLITPTNQLSPSLSSGLISSTDSNAKHNANSLTSINRSNVESAILSSSSFAGANSILANSSVSFPSLSFKIFYINSKFCDNFSADDHLFSSHFSS